MTDVKWIKVAVDMFEDSKIDFIRSLPEGDAILVTWIQMLSIAGQSNMSGYLMVAEGIPYTEQLLSTKLRRSPTIMQFALEMLSKLKMINVEDGPYHITNWEKHQNVSGLEKLKSDTAKRVAKHREKLKEKALLLQGNVTKPLHVTRCNATDIELDIELDKEKDLKHIVVKDDSAIAFETFWSAYPTKGSNKKMSLAKWNTLWKNKQIDMEQMLNGVNGYTNHQEHWGYKTCAAQVFLNQERWLDDWSFAPRPSISENRTSIPNSRNNQSAVAGMDETQEAISEMKRAVEEKKRRIAEQRGEAQ